MHLARKGKRKAGEEDCRNHVHCAPQLGWPPSGLANILRLESVVNREKGKYGLANPEL